MLHLAVVRNAAGVTERKVLEQESWDSTLVDDVTGRADNDRRNAVRFQISGRQTDGLVTDRSDGYEEGDIDAVFAAQPQDLRGIHRAGAAVAVLGRHPVEAMRQAAKAALQRQRL